MSYTRGQEEDERLHRQYHRAMKRGIVFSNTREMQVVASHAEGTNGYGGRVVLLPERRSAAHARKLEQILAKMSEELGTVHAEMDQPAGLKIYVYLSSGNAVVGCLIAEPIRWAYRAERSAAGTVAGDAVPASSEGVVYAQTHAPIRCVCGISRIWVARHARRHGVATRMLDALRNSFVYACVLQPDQIAFSQPTSAGARLAEHYQKRQDFLAETKDAARLECASLESP
ncbi:ESCO1/2 acetyl-transferase-domain-containing protein [Thamnocephalis sphaerospora]|uniref:ESCO1/2 acetyl-transferase-domain-containing protein n=1 Tax=Thamnocephalis sphaerospora TaxID=78915 RepID=A0A4P9XX28_9FUNG|nr:ESCO1/2 acetyl-transferase-domain-containing protein [Thamnocephalis sphaerospora]|eukprot:RKP10928.1 ESCO1/2 acetyl-transferase-domain-containing protein [Thamnocephalis sphaerospora]